MTRGRARPLAGVHIPLGFVFLGCGLLAAVPEVDCLHVAHLDLQSRSQGTWMHESLDKSMARLCA